MTPAAHEATTGVPYGARSPRRLAEVGPREVAWALAAHRWVVAHVRDSRRRRSCHRVVTAVWAVVDPFDSTTAGEPTLIATNRGMADAAGLASADSARDALDALSACGGPLRLVTGRADGSTAPRRYALDYTIIGERKEVGPAAKGEGGK